MGRARSLRAGRQAGGARSARSAASAQACLQADARSVQHALHAARQQPPHRRADAHGGDEDACAGWERSNQADARSVLHATAICRASLVFPAPDDAPPLSNPQRQSPSIHQRPTRGRRHAVGQAEEAEGGHEEEAERGGREQEGCVCGLAAAVGAARRCHREQRAHWGSCDDGGCGRRRVPPLARHGCRLGLPGTQACRACPLAGLRRRSTLPPPPPAQPRPAGRLATHLPRRWAWQTAGPTRRTAPPGTTGAATATAGSQSSATGWKARRCPARPGCRRGAAGCRASRTPPPARPAVGGWAGEVGGQQRSSCIVQCRTSGARHCRPRTHPCPSAQQSSSHRRRQHRHQGQLRHAQQRAGGRDVAGAQGEQGAGGASPERAHRAAQHAQQAHKGHLPGVPPARGTQVWGGEQ